MLNMGQRFTMGSQEVLCPQGVLNSRVDRAAGAGAPFFVLCPVVHAKHSLAPAEALAWQPRRSGHGGQRARLSRALNEHPHCKGLHVPREPES